MMRLRTIVKLHIREPNGRRVPIKLSRATARVAPTQCERGVGATFMTVSTRVIVALVVIGTLGIIIAGLLHPSTPQEASSVGGSAGLRVGSLAPDFTLSMLNGKRVSLSDYRGKVVMLNFWYATCPGCSQEMAGMQKFYAAQQVTGKSFVILGVNILDDEQTAMQFVQQHGLTFPIVLDQKQQVLTLYNVNDTPTSYFIDSKGAIRSIVVGPIDDTMLKQDVAQISQEWMRLMSLCTARTGWLSKAYPVGRVW
jgi:peroxiredoxin